jgi:hypothetical protein
MSSHIHGFTCQLCSRSIPIYGIICYKFGNGRESYLHWQRQHHQPNSTRRTITQRVDCILDQSSGQRRPEIAAAAAECEAEVYQLYLDVIAEEKAWAEYLFKKVL